MRSRAAIALLVGCLLSLALPAGALALALLSSFGSLGVDAGQISEPRGIAIGPEGTIYVADTHNDRVVAYSPNGDFAFAFGAGVEPSGGGVCTASTGCEAGTKGNAAGMLDRPADVAVDGAGEVFVVSPDNSRVDVFSAAGAFLRAFGYQVSQSGDENVCTIDSGCRRGEPADKAGALQKPMGVGVDAAGRVFVADTENNLISVFSAAGEFLFVFGRNVGSASANICTGQHDDCHSGDRSGPGGMDEPLDVGIDADGQVAVADSKNHRIDVFDVDAAAPSSTFLFSAGEGVLPAGGDVCTSETGCNNGQASGAAASLDLPSAVGLDASGDIYVADTANNRISEFGPTGDFIRSFGRGVVDGGAAFQVCTRATGCATGAESVEPGSVSSSQGVAIDCAGAIYATEWMSSTMSRVERFGEPDTPSCAEPEAGPDPEAGSPDSGSGSASGSGSGSGFAFSAAASPALSATVGIAKPKFKIELNKRNGTATVLVIVSNTGTLLLRGRGIRKVRRAAKRVGEVELLLEGNRKVKRKLKRRHKAKVKLSLTFMPDGGGAITQVARATLKLRRSP